jgi:hypothetical protein
MTGNTHSRGKDSQPGRDATPDRRGEAGTLYLIFRLVKAGSSRFRRLYLAADRTWTRNAAEALRGALGPMKALMGKAKTGHPDLILERIEDPGGLGGEGRKAIESREEDEGAEKRL